MKFHGYHVDTMDLHNLGHHSWNDFVARAARRINESAANGGGESSKRPDYNWYHTDSLNHAVDMAIKGWPDGASHIAAKIDNLPPAAATLPEWDMDVVGSIVNVPAFIAGEPECMFRMSECKRAEHRVSIVVSGVYSGAVEAYEAQNYATAVAAVIRTLESEGINPAVYMITSNTKQGHAAYAVTVRDFGEPLDLARIAFAFHPSFLRRIQFAWQEITPEAIAVGWGYSPYGTVGRLSKELVSTVLGDVGYVALVPDLNIVHGLPLEQMIARIRDSVSEAIKQM